MEAFTNDFKDFEALYGARDEKDPYNWAQFKLNHEDDLENLEAELAAVEGKSQRSIQSSPENGREMRELDVADYVTEDDDGNIESETGGVDRRRRIKFTDIESGEEKLVPIEDHRFLKDEEGHLWAGFIIHNDTTQKITPGVRILSFRTLVVVGNGRGTAGFGKGKGLTADLALASAFRFDFELASFML